jgi:hypothetical protein
VRVGVKETGSFEQRHGRYEGKVEKLEQRYAARECGGKGVGWRGSAWCGSAGACAQEMGQGMGVFGKRAFGRTSGEGTWESH